MKSFILSFLLLSSLAAFGGDAFDSFVQQQQLAALQDIQRQQQQAIGNAQLQQYLARLHSERACSANEAAAIKAAYPNNPALYRYLDRNPRYVPYYLGQ